MVAAGGRTVSAFDLVSAGFGLLPGLVIAEVSGGFASVLKFKRSARPVRTGWLTPLPRLFGLLIALLIVHNRLWNGDAGGGQHHHAAHRHIGGFRLTDQPVAAAMSRSGAVCAAVSSAKPK